MDNPIETTCIEAKADEKDVDESVIKNVVNRLRKNKRNKRFATGAVIAAVMIPVVIILASHKSDDVAVDTEEEIEETD